MKRKLSWIMAAAMAAGSCAALAQEAEEPVVVNDGGVEAVRVYEETAPAERAAPAPRDAAEEVRTWIKDKGWKIGRWDKEKKRLIVVTKEEFDCKDPATMPDVMTQRDLAAKRAVLQAKAEMIEYVKSEVSAEDLVESMGGYAKEASAEEKAAVEAQVEKFKSQTQVSSMATAAEMPLFGVTCIRQSESWNRGKYQIAVAMVWSPALERSARAVLTGDKVVCKPKANGQSLEDWLESVNVAVMSGPMQFVDADGTRWFLGISAGAADDDLDALELKTNRRIADLSAKQMLVFSLFADVKANEVMKQAGAMKSVGGKSTVESAQWMESAISQSVKDLPVRGMGQLFGEEVEHPVTGGRIYVSIYGLNQDDAEAAIEMEAKSYLARAGLERAKTVERGRAAANKALVESATNDPKDFQRGYEAQNAVIRGTQSLQQREDAPARVKQSQAGVFNSGADVDDDDL
ncbi:MAG: hypothetical protein IJT88_07735 [Kiritimatiellae bacterium]|nr:hypothetical protein [Kiritimatiellia bacterium]